MRTQREDEVATQPVAITNAGGPSAARLRSAEELCAAVVLASAVFLGASLFKGAWLIDWQGLAIPSDFVNVWAAGRLVLEGHPAAAYDWTIHKQAEVEALGHAFATYGSWSYPPPFLFVGAALAKLPYFVAFAVWMGVTWAVFALTLREIVGHRLGLFLAGAFPATWLNVSVGQNGFFTAALIGGTLLLLEKRPVLAGVCLGILTYKPQFGLLFPLFLVVAGYWRAFAAAAVVAVAVALASYIAFGSAAWAAFFAVTPMNAKAVLSDGMIDFAKLQSVFGLVRALGGSETAAWWFQIPTALATAVGVAILWRRPVPFELKAAALAIGTLFITPYVFAYDLTIFALSTAFLISLGLRTGFWSGEAAALVAAAVCILLFPFAVMPTGLLAMLIASALILRRVMVGERPLSAEARS
jgi:arabinofuranan 3-O-arabinosyltransferase